MLNSILNVVSQCKKEFSFQDIKKSLQPLTNLVAGKLQEISNIPEVKQSIQYAKDFKQKVEAKATEVARTVYEELPSKEVSLALAVTAVTAISLISRAISVASLPESAITTAAIASKLISISVEGAKQTITSAAQYVPNPLILA